jgi:hypothetical protein
MLVVGSVGAGCLPGSGPALIDTSDEAGIDGSADGAPIVPKNDVDLGDPFALEGVAPSHGPFTGGTRAVLAGRGFSSKLRVFIGGVEVSQGNVLASDPTRASIVTPPGPPGPVDIKLRDEGTAKERILREGFVYDAFVVTPDSGATSGGTRVTITGAGTEWVKGATEVLVGGVACNAVDVVSTTKLDCLTPPGTPGAKDVTIKASGKSWQARDAFTYSDSPDGYRGGLGGGAFAGRVRVLAFDSMTGTPIAGAKAIAGAPLASAVVKDTSAGGVAEITGLPGDKVTVTVAAKCHQPITFVDVPVDTVTTYLNPVLDPACAAGDPPSTGGRGGRYGGIVEGQLVFPGGGEFQKVGWTTVPSPSKPTERRAAYVFEVSPSPNETFTLPPASEAITPETSGTTGYKFSVVVYPGNVTLYVVAGLEDRSEDPPRFMPYSMGVVRGVSVPPQTRVSGVDVKMDILFDHQVTVAPQPPAPGPRGPDRLAAHVALTLGANAFAILPQGVRVAPLPAPATIPFVGVPSLDHAIAGEQYVLGAVAATGAGLLRPASVVSRVRTTNANDTVALGGFLGVPVHGEPGAGAWSGTHVQFSGAAGPSSLSLVQVTSGAGLVTWTIVAPAGVTSFDVPDLAALPGPTEYGLVRGPISTTVYVARIDGFSYGRLRYGNLSQGSWTAHAFDTLNGAY